MNLSEQLACQDKVFSADFSRVELLTYRVTGYTRKFRVLVLRNHSFELVSRVMPLYLDYAGMDIDFRFSDYDDSFSLVGLDLNVDAVLVWLDSERYKGDFREFLQSRLVDISRLYNGPVLVCAIGKASFEVPRGVVLVDIQEVMTRLGESFWDFRMEAYTGTKISNAACLSLAQLLGLKYFPAVLITRIKAVVVDLDNTLYAGVLGEDGIAGMRLTSGHVGLQEELKRLSKLGIFLCAVSKNDEDDVRRIWDCKVDFPLDRGDFTEIKASWRPKSEVIRDLVCTLNIGVDSVLYVDDNPGEIVEVVAALPEIRALRADPQGFGTVSALKMFPGLFVGLQTREDGLRKADVWANGIRESLRAGLSQEDYLKKLNMEVSLIVDDANGAERISQLSGKTNQFIFSYARYSLENVRTLIADPHTVIVSMHLRDCLSDSGMIGAVVLKKQNEFALLEECFVSCRALGRGIEWVLLSKAIEIGLRRLCVDSLKVKFVRGERNAPAEKFVNEHLCSYLTNPSFFAAADDNGLVRFTLQGGRE